MRSGGWSRARSIAAVVVGVSSEVKDSIWVRSRAWALLAMSDGVRFSGRSAVMQGYLEAKAGGFSLQA